MAQFMLFVRGGENSGAELSAAQAEAARAPYSRWAGALQAQGRLVHAEEIHGKFFRLTRPNGHVVTEGPLPEPRDGIGGYFIFRADSEADALTIAEACPILERCGFVELHRIVE